LVKGTYYISQIAVTGFQGRFVGMGQGVTIIQALPNLPPPTPEYNTPPSPFWAGLPGPSNPWPVLLTFVNGAFSISGMTITEPYATPISSPGWTAELFGGPYTSLFDAILVTGQQAYAAIDHVAVLGASGDCFGAYSICWALQYGGYLLPSGFTDAIGDQIPLTGTFSLSNTASNSVESAVWVWNVASASATECNNIATNVAFTFSVIDASSSKLLFCGNQGVGAQGFNVMQVSQSVFKSNSPSTVYITGNSFQASDGANVIYLGDSGTVKTLNVVVSGNVLRTDTSCGCYDPTNPSAYSAIQTTSSFKSLVISGNTIIGGGAAGIYVTGGPGQVFANNVVGANTGVQVDYANNVHVTANLIRNSGQWGIAVTDGSSNNVITGNFVHGSGAYDLYWDNTGTGNVWHENFCSTSSPSGLC